MTGFIDEITKLATKKDHAKDTMSDAIAGAGSGAVATAITLPLETLQIAESVSKKGKKELVKSLYNEGKTLTKNDLSKMSPKALANVQELVSKGKLVENGRSGELVYKGLKGVAKGVGRFYKGLDTKILKVAPTMGISFAAYQGIKRSLADNE